MNKKSQDSRSLTALSPKAWLDRDWGHLNSWLSIHIPHVRRITAYFLLMVLAIFACVMIFIFVELLDQYEAMQEEQASIQKVLTYWQQVIRTQSSSPDVYFQAAIAAYQIGDRVDAYDYVNKALFLDPDFSQAQELREKIQNN